MKDKDQQRVLRSTLKKYTSSTITDITKLKSQLLQVKKQGFALNNEEFGKGLFGLAVPVHNERYNKLINQAKHLCH